MPESTALTFSSTAARRQIGAVVMATLRHLRWSGRLNPNCRKLPKLVRVAQQLSTGRKTDKLVGWSIQNAYIFVHSLHFAH